MKRELPEELKRGRFQLRDYELNSVKRPTKAVQKSALERARIRRKIEDFHEKIELDKEFQYF